MKIRYVILSAILLFTLLVNCKKEVRNGKNSLVDIIPEPAGVNCNSGGFKIIAGIDLNNNNVLDTSEIQNSEYLCNGVNGANGNEGNEGKNSLIKILPEVAGENCNSGGYKVLTGIDWNSNNTLDDNEVQNLNYVCNGSNGSNGTDGLTTLLNIIPVAAGEVCPSGGFKIISGLDLNTNNILDDNEIQCIRNVCNGDNGENDKMVFINFPSGITESTIKSSGNISTVNIIPDFTLSRYEQVDSIVFGAYIYTSNANCSAFLELYNLSSGTAINNTTISSNSLTKTWVTTGNIIKYLPSGNFDLGMRLRTGVNGTDVFYSNPSLRLFRK